MRPFCEPVDVRRPSVVIVAAAVFSCRGKKNNGQELSQLKHERIKFELNELTDQSENIVNLRFQHLNEVISIFPNLIEI